MGMMTGVVLAGALAVQAGAGMGAAKSPPCPAGAAASGEWQGWSALQGVTAGSSMAMPATLAIGRSARATLVPAGGITFPVATDHAGEPGTNGGVFAFDVVTAGTYRVALGSAAWVDVVAGGKAVTSVGHGHGSDCSGVRKYVDFPAKPGRYMLQVSGNKAATLVVMVTRVEA